MKLKFNPFGWIVCYCENDGFMRFDTKSEARSWVRENPDSRSVCSECIIEESK
jgi:hypothetical protein